MLGEMVLHMDRGVWTQHQGNKAQSSFVECSGCRVRCFHSWGHECMLNEVLHMDRSVCGHKIREPERRVCVWKVEVVGFSVSTL